MSAHTIRKILDLLRGASFLRTQELLKLERSLAEAPTPHDFVRTALKSRWLTPYQVRELFAGRGHNLLVGEFVVLEKLGEGSTSRVFKARQQQGEQIVALKVQRDEPDENGAGDRLRRECWVGSQLDHPNILRTLGLGRAGDTLFLIMEYVAGQNLAQLLRERGPLPVGRACDYARQVSLGLAHAAKRGLVHRDVKPSNLLLAAGRGVIKVLDLGIAKFSGSEPSADNLVSGTPDYVAPEQVYAPGQTDTRSDVYALGCTLYHLLSGSLPFPGGTREEKLLRHLHEEPRAIEQLRHEVAPALARVIRRMMKKVPNERFATLAAVADALTPFAEPGDCDSYFVLEVGESDVEELDPSQRTAVLRAPTTRG